MTATRRFEPRYVLLAAASNCAPEHPGHATGTHRSAEPVSMSTSSTCAGVPKLSGP